MGFRCRYCNGALSYLRAQRRNKFGHGGAEESIGLGSTGINSDELTDADQSVTFSPATSACQHTEDPEGFQPCLVLATFGSHYRCYLCWLVCTDDTTGVLRVWRRMLSMFGTELLFKDLVPIVPRRFDWLCKERIGLPLRTKQGYGRMLSVGLLAASTACFFYNLIRGIEGMFVSSGFHRKFALPWVLLVSTVACLNLFGLLGRLHPAQAFAAHSSLNTTSTCGTNGMPHMCAIEVDAETTGNIDARRLRVRSSVPGIHGDSPFSPDVVDARRVFLLRRRRKHSSVSCNIRYLFATYVRSRADAQEDENFLPGEISRVAVGRHCELFYSITLPLHDGVLVRLLILLTVVVATVFGMHVDWLRRAHGGSSVSTRSIRWSSPLPHWCSAQSVGHLTLSLEWSLSSWVA